MCLWCYRRSEKKFTWAISAWWHVKKIFNPRTIYLFINTWILFPFIFACFRNKRFLCNIICHLFSTPDRQAVMFSFDKVFAAESTTLRANWYHRERFWRFELLVRTVLYNSVQPCGQLWPWRYIHWCHPGTQIDLYRNTNCQWKNFSADNLCVLIHVGFKSTLAVGRFQGIAWWIKKVWQAWSRPATEQT